MLTLSVAWSASPRNAPNQSPLFSHPSDTKDIAARCGVFRGAQFQKVSFNVSQQETGSEVATVKTQLADYFEIKADWRSNWASGSYRPMRDAKNQGYAQALNEMAAYVRGLPDDSPVLLKLAATGCSLDSYSLDELGLHTGTIHCTGGADWFAGWVDNLISTTHRSDSAMSEDERQERMVELFRESLEGKDLNGLFGEERANKLREEEVQSQLSAEEERLNDLDDQELFGEDALERMCEEEIERRVEEFRETLES